MRLQRMFICIEVWSKSSDGKSDALIGLVKIPASLITQSYFGGDLNVSRAHRHSMVSALMTSQVRKRF